MSHPECARAHNLIKWGKECEPFRLKKKLDTRTEERLIFPFTQDHITPHFPCSHCTALSAENARAAGLSARRTSTLLQPRDESLKRERLRKRASTAGRSRGSRRSNRGGASSGNLGSCGGSDGSSRGGSGGRASRSRGSGVTRAGGAGARASAGEEGWTGHLVVGVVAIDVDLDAGVGRGVELVGCDALGGLGAGAGDFQVEA